MFVLGTAGHIDHGKSVLVKALTGIDPDRLREEKERGMTIDLGFAWLKLPSNREVGIVDVPGHERFVKNMLAGVGGIDLALLIIAANEGIMPQTKEHLAILDLIGVRHGVVAITKKDLVDEELLTLVRMEVEELIASTTIAGAPVVAVSALNGEGLPELLSAIDAQLDKTEPRKDLGRPRLAIDRIFTIAGAGTVVTGTLIDGTLTVGQEVEIVPSGLKSRIRGLQTHKSKEEVATQGSRVAANLVGVNTSQLTRGDIVTVPGWLKPARMVTANLKLIDYLKRPLRHNTQVSFHTLAAETMAKVRLLEGDELKPGQSMWAQLKLEKPLAIINGDRFIIRSPMETLGGGGIVDVRAKRLRRNRPDIINNLKAREGGTSEELIMALLETRQPLEASAVAAQGNIAKDEAQAAIESLIGQGRIIALGEGERRLLLTAAGWKNLKDKVLSALKDYHKKYPMRPGMPRAEFATRLKLGGNIVLVLDNLVKQGSIVEEAGNLRLPSHAVSLTPAQQGKIDAFLKSLAASPFAPPSDLIPEPDLLNLLVAQGKAVKVSDNVVFSAKAYNEMVNKITARIKTKGKITLGEVRDMFGTSRKYVQALLEYLDREKITRRVGDDRVLY
ncbi:MAG: selenocysteine-specific translation elongation factor [Dehalococcoidales bacterium]|nr:selenocysteine-specific translation elongation factor [Dehalococcoidales bacterium]